MAVGRRTCQQNMTMEHRANLEWRSQNAVRLKVAGESFSNHFDEPHYVTQATSEHRERCRGPLPHNHARARSGIRLLPAASRLVDGAREFVTMARAHSGCEVWHQDLLRLDLPTCSATSCTHHAGQYQPGDEIRACNVDVKPEVVSGGIYHGQHRATARTSAPHRRALGRGRELPCSRGVHVDCVFHLLLSCRVVCAPSHTRAGSTSRFRAPGLQNQSALLAAVSVGRELTGRMLAQRGTRVADQKLGRSRS